VVDHGLCRQAMANGILTKAVLPFCSFGPAAKPKMLPSARIISFISRSSRGNSFHLAGGYRPQNSGNLDDLALLPAGYTALSG
jgi:hypothetical protein